MVTPSTQTPSPAKNFYDDTYVINDTKKSPVLNLLASRPADAQPRLKTRLPLGGVEGRVRLAYQSHLYHMLR